MSQGTRILNVNDHAGARYTISLMLRRAGFDVVEAASGEEALGMLDQRPDLVVLDVKLPDMDGFEVCRRIRQNPQTASVKVLHTSATFVTLDKRVQGLESGADGYLVQPFEPEELVAIVNNLLKLAGQERELVEKADRLVENDRRKDEFLAMLAHELRNPLAAISASIPLLCRRPPIDAVEARARQILQRQTLHLGRLIHDLLDVARVTQGKIALQEEILDIRQLITDAAETIRRNRTDHARQDLRVQLPPRPVFVEGDPNRLEQMLANLLDNASKYSEAGSRIELTLDRDDARGLACIKVRDFGVGMEPHALQSIFGLFSQVDASIDRSRGGLGIGLTLVHKLAELHGGTVTARSEGLGRGSEFEVQLPMLRAARIPAGDELHAQGPSEPTERPKRHVLIVEDNAEVRQSLADLCETFGHRVSIATDGPSGVARALAEIPDIALVDIGLPGFDGYEVARRLRQDPRGQPLYLVSLSGYGAPDDGRQSLQAGFDLHLVKPLNPEKLDELLHRA